MSADSRNDRWNAIYKAIHLFIEEASLGVDSNAQVALTYAVEAGLDAGVHWADQMERSRAQGWDEGHAQGWIDGSAMSLPAANPYRVVSDAG